MDELLARELWVKLLLAFACGAAIGLERELNDKPAGLRTNMLICVGSTLITMISLHVSLTYASRQVNIADPARIAAQIVSGIGFLGAGTIIQARGAVHGLTTAATLWVMAGIGLAIGSGAFAAAIVTTLILLAILSALGRLEAMLVRRRHFVMFQVVARRDPELLDVLNRIAEGQRASVDDIQLSREGDRMTAEFSLTCSTEARDAIVRGLLDHDSVEDIRYSS